VLGPTK